MKRLEIFLISVFVAFSISCERDVTMPIDIFATQELTDPFNLKLGNDSGLDTLIVNSDRIIETAEGFHIKGTIFSKSVSGIIPVTSGDFKINTGQQPAAFAKGFGGIEFSGYGTATFPEHGILSLTEVDDIPGSEVYYNKGKIFKTESKVDNLPLLDERYYFRHRLDKSGNGKEYRMKNITLKLREYYLDARDPAALFVGDIFTQNKTGVKNLLVEKGSVGISANELWDFTPYKYSDNLETVTGGTGFERMNGGISLTGVIPIKKYPLKILGRAVINTSYSNNGPLDFFERGFYDASFRIGVNGELFFTNKLVTFLTSVDTVKLGKATLQAEFSDDNFSVRMAGEYSNSYLNQFLGETMMSFIPYNSKEGVMYLRCSENPDDFIIYIEENVSLQIPGLGMASLANSVFRLTKNEVGLSGSLALPYSIGNVNVTGVLRSDGSFLLKGFTNCNIDLGSGLRYNADLEVEVSEKGVKFLGAMDLPYGIGNVDVSGGLLSDEIYFNGSIQSAIVFPVNASVSSNLLVQISSKTGIGLAGSLDLPGGIGSVDVNGSLKADELLLTGMIQSGVRINFGNVDIHTKASMSLSASSKTGVIMTGSVALPFSFGDAGVNIRVISSGLSMTGDLGSHINISGYPLFNADMNVSASTTTDMYLYGSMKFPGGIGWTSVSGYVRNSGYGLTGNISSSTFDFGIVKLSTDFSMSITNTSGIKITAEGEGCINVLLDEICDTVGVDVNINYSTGSVELCMGFPVVGDACIGW